MAAVDRETQEEHPRNGQPRNTSVPRIMEEQITQVFEEIEGRLIKKLSQEFGKTESQVCGALSEIEIFFEPTDTDAVRNRSGNIPEHKYWKPEASGDRSHNDRHPEVGPYVYQSRHSNDSDPDEAPQKYFPRTFGDRKMISIPFSNSFAIFFPF